MTLRLRKLLLRLQTQPLKMKRH
jgi:hypothetical protein